MNLFDASAYIGDWAIDRLAFSTSQALLSEIGAQIIDAVLTELGV